jgi:predicted phosphodiesterase
MAGALHWSVRPDEQRLTGEEDTLSRAQKAIIFGCLHAPFHDESAVEWLLGRINKVQPDYVAFIGDALEANAASRWPDAVELNLSLETEFKALNTFLENVRKACPKSKRIFMAGNHDNNLLGTGRIDPRVRSLCDWKRKENVPSWESWKIHPHYEYCRRRGSLQLGQQIILSHGYETSATRMDRECLYMSAGQPSSLYVTAHTHRSEHPKMVTWGDLPMNRWRANVGCLRDLKPQYMARKSTWNWSHALVNVEFMPLKSPRQHKEWSANTEVFKTYDEWAESN